MGNIKIIRGAFGTKLELKDANVVAGFPSPADDYTHETLDFNRDYIRHPEATFYAKVEGDRLLRQDLMKMYRLFDGYGKDQMLLAVLAYNVGPYAILGTSKRPRSTLLRKLDAGNRNIFHDYMRFCRYKGRKVKSIERRRYVEFSLLFIQ